VSTNLAKNSFVGSPQTTTKGVPVFENEGASSGTVVTVNEQWLRSNWQAVMTQVYNLCATGSSDAPKDWISAPNMSADATKHRWEGVLPRMEGWELHPDAAIRMFAFAMFLDFVKYQGRGIDLVLMEESPGSPNLRLGIAGKSDCVPFMMVSTDSPMTPLPRRGQRVIGIRGN